MSSDITEVDDDSPVHPGEHHDHGPTDRQYFQIFIILVVLTALEVSTEWWPEDSRSIAVPLLIFLMVVKFFLVALWFMHLKWDPKLLKRTFYSGMVIAIAVYVVALSAMNFWTNSGSDGFNDPPPFCTGSDCPS